MVISKNKKIFAVLMCAIMAFAVMAFSIGNNNMKVANAATSGQSWSVDFGAWSADSTKAPGSATHVTFDETGFLSDTTGKTDYATFTVPSGNFKYNAASSTNIATKTLGSSTGYTADVIFSFTVSKTTNVKMLISVPKLIQYFDTTGTMTGATTGTATFNKTAPYVIAGSTISTAQHDMLVYVEAQINVGTTNIAINPHGLTDNSGSTARKIFIYGVECAPVASAPVATYAIGDGTYATATELAEQTATKNAEDKYVVKTPVNDAVAKADSGYTFVGWSVNTATAESCEIINSNTDVELTENSTINAVYAKIEFIGVSFRKGDVPGARYGFTAVCVTDTSDATTQFVPATTEFTDGKFNLFLESVEVSGSPITATDFVSVENLNGFSGINYNLVIVNFKQAHGSKNIKVDASCKINGIDLTIVSSGDILVKDKAGLAYEASQLTETEAVQYGYTVPQA